MKTISLINYIYLGTNIWYLQVVRGGTAYSGPGFVKANVDSLLRRLSEYGLVVSYRAAKKLEKYNSDLATEVEENKISEEQAKRIRELAKSLRPTIDAEADGLHAHIINEHRYDSYKLLNSPLKFFNDDVCERLPDIAIGDIEEAAKCIAYERATAVAFHLMRATEAALKEYYCSKVKRSRVQMMWGPMVSHLRKRPKPDVILLDHLDGIRRNFRNPTQHPDKVYDMNEAQDLFGVCIDVLNRVAAGLPVRA
jgi:hypothetical protein